MKGELSDKSFSNRGESVSAKGWVYCAEVECMREVSPFNLTNRRLSVIMDLYYVKSITNFLAFSTTPSTSPGPSTMRPVTCPPSWLAAVNVESEPDSMLPDRCSRRIKAWGFSDVAYARTKAQWQALVHRVGRPLVPSDHVKKCTYPSMFRINHFNCGPTANVKESASLIQL